MSYLGQFVFGALIGAVFDWALVYLFNGWRLTSPLERRQALLVVYAWHGPWFALALPLFLGGLAAQGFIALGLKAEVAGMAALPASALIGGLGVWLAHQLPAVRSAKAAVWEQMRAAHQEQNRRFGRALGFSASRPSSKPPET